MQTKTLSRKQHYTKAFNQQVYVALVSPSQRTREKAALLCATLADIITTIGRDV